MSAPTRRQRRAMVLLLVVSLAFVTLDYRSSSFAGIRSATQTVFGPVQRGLTAVFAPVGRFLAGIPDAAGSRSRIEQLQRENADLRRRLRESTLTGSRADELRRLELLAGLGQYRVVPATVVALQTRARVGDRLVTGPYGGSTYVAGVPVGEVTAVSDDPTTPAEASVRPYVTFAALDLVGIVLAGPRTDPRDSVLPASPTHTPSPTPTSLAPTAQPGTRGAGPSGTP